MRNPIFGNGERLWFWDFLGLRLYLKRITEIYIAIKTSIFGDIKFVLFSLHKVLSSLYVISSDLVFLGTFLLIFFAIATMP
jgi:hypothetical protein